MALSLSQGAFNARMAALAGVPFRGYRLAARARRSGIIPAIRRASRMIPVLRRIPYKSSRQFKNALKKRSERRRVGDTPKKDTSKRRTVVDTGCIARDTQTLYSWDLTQLGAQADGIDSRERDVVRIGGWRVDYEVQNKVDAPVYINMAVISAKTCPGVDLDTNFFRSAGVQRAVNYSTTATDLERHVTGINTDRWIILMHRRIRLAGQVDSSPGTPGNQFSSGKTSYATISRYVKLGRQVRFDADTDTVPQSKVYLVIWYGRLCGNGTVVTGAVEHNLKVRCWFRDP